MDRTALSLALFIGIAVAFGGGTVQGSAADPLLGLLALPFLMAAIVRLRWSSFDVDTKLFIAFGLLLIGWLVAQQIPLPPAMWKFLAGRGELATELATAGLVDTWRPITLDREASFRAVLGFLPAYAAGLLALTLPISQRVALLKWVIAFAAVSAMLGLAQLADGADSALRWHAVTNPTSAVGPFANRNHLASLLATTMPLAAALMLAAAKSDGRIELRPLKIAVAALLLIAMIIGLAMTRSRAGVGIGMLAFAGAGLLAWRVGRSSVDASKLPHSLRWLFAATLLATVLVVQFALIELVQRFEKDPLDDQRWEIAQTTFEAVKHFGALGTGAATFVPVYQSLEPQAQIGSTYVNRAHNDFLEWWLEGGLPLLLIAIAGLALLTRWTTQAWTAKRYAVWRVAAALGVWVTVVHSLFDYPLRTVGISVVFVVLLSCLVGGAGETEIRVRRVRKPTTKLDPQDLDAADGT